MRQFAGEMRATGCLLVTIRPWPIGMISDLDVELLAGARLLRGLDDLLRRRGRLVLGPGIGGSFAGGEAIAAEPNVVMLETFIRRFLRALSQRQHYQGPT